MAPAAARAELESLLRARKLDRTFSVTQPLLVTHPTDRLVTTGVPTLDAALRGGVPRGQISELVGAASSGRTAVLHRLLAQATGQGELAAVVDVCDAFDPAAAAAQGVRLDHLLWVRGEAESAVSRAIKALNLVVSAGGFGLVVFDAGGVPARALAQLPFTTWLRVHRVIEGGDTACVLLADAPLARSTGGASVRLGPERRSEVTQRAVVPDFHARVRANRYVTGSDPGTNRRGQTPPGLWRGTGPHARRFSGVSMHADVQYALRNASCALTATEPQRDLATETQSAQRSF
jgi:recombination protein RecA